MRHAIADVGSRKTFGGILASHVLGIIRVGVKGLDKVGPGKGKPRTGEHSGRPHPNLKIRRGLKADLEPIEKWLRLDVSRTEQSCSIQFELSPGELAQKILSPDGTENVGEQRNSIRRHVIQLQHEERFRIVAQQKRTRITRSEPPTLFADRDLKIVEIHPDRALDDSKTIDARSRIGYGKSKVRVGNCRQSLSRIGRRTWSMLGLTAEVEEKRAKHGVATHSGHVVEPLSVGSPVVVDDRLPK